MRQLLDRATEVFTAVAIVTTLVLMLVVVADAVSRYVIGASIVGVYEISSEYLVVVGVFFALGLAFQTRSLIRISIVIDLLPGPVRRFIDAANRVVSALVCAVLAFAAFRQMLRVFEDHTTSSGVLAYLLWPAYLAVFLGLLLLLLHLVLDVFVPDPGPDAEDSAHSNV